MALGVDVCHGHLNPDATDATAGSLAKQIKDAVDAWTNDQDDFVAAIPFRIGGNGIVFLVHK